jgi:hypothetical protein
MEVDKQFFSMLARNRPLQSQDSIFREHLNHAEIQPL